ncbi:hemagglutinin repeat-containing protein [Campylobacter concisus]|uniref:hemagglutinin repeat-containing protein n=1 Tax=Campylobacter concisus TaxID=199 RepID=UPI0015E1A311|nr:hemagglutinin repeat-containing protein [Campylobacter concisus]
MGWLQCHKRINKKSWHIASAAAASSGTYGFSVGVRADLATTKQESSLKQTSSNKSSLNAKHININSAKDISITGSDLASKEDMSLNSNNLNINSSEDSLKYKSNTKSLTTGFGFTFYGANSSSLELGTNSLKQSEQSLTNNNSHLYSAKDMNINTANDATIKGANLRADERLNLKVGNNLSLESTRDIKDASSKSKGINLSASYSGATNAKNFASGDRSLSSVGASISKSSSNTKIKQTNLSSITANELNVEVGKNTHLKGSLLAAGEYDKDNTFIDNHNLNLKTNTLSYENLSNTSYNKGSSLSIGANYSVGKKDDSKASQSGQGKSDSSYSGLKSIDLSNHRNLSYTLSKNLATLGSGNIEIADKDNSDDLTRLNRDTTKLTKDLVNTSISSNVDGSIDLRVLTKSGQKDIKDEFNTVSTIAKAIELISTTKNAKLSSFFNYVDDLVKGYDKDKILLELNLKVMENQSASILEKEQAASNIAAMYGVNVKFANLESYSGGKFNPEDPNSIYLNTATLGDTKTFLTALRHELVHRKDNEAGKFIPQDKFQNEFATNLALKKLDMSKKALALNGKKIDNFNLNIDKDDPAILANTNHFYSLDQSKSDDWVMQAVGGATSLGGTIIRGGASSIVTEAYNQDKYNKNGVDMKSIAAQGLFGSSIGLASGAAGLVGKNIIKKSGVIGRHINESLKTYEYELGGTVGFGAATLKSYIENKKENGTK